MELHSSAFKAGQPIPAKFTCDGPDISPPLEWSGSPSGTKTFALICDDPDAPGGTWVHWVLFNVPGTASNLPENILKTRVIAGGARQGINDFRRLGYGGPCPPGGVHRYFFKLYALDSEIKLDPGITKGDLERTMKGHVIGQAELMGTYKR